MTNARDWYAKRVQQPQQQPPPQQYAQPQQPQYAPQPQQQQQYVQPQQQQAPQQVTVQNLYEAAAHWRGGAATRTEQQLCPECGSGQFFSRAGKSRMPPPAPHCYNCGFNGLFDQANPQVWGAS
jgi:predicted RNA-binding Zn-ribbon protein involved in translation (DUF1610 family)